MEGWVFAAVLMAAAMHAGWNALVKTGLDSFLTMTLITVCVGLMALALTPFVRFPAAAAWPWLFASMGLHIGYKLFLLRAYRSGDMSQVYPIARGTAPLLVAVVMATVFGERLGAVAATGMGLLVLGVWLMSVRGGQSARVLDGAAVGYALATSLFIAGYTLVDGMGARANGDPHGYVVWLFVLEAPLIVIPLVASRGPGALRQLWPAWRVGVMGGALSLGAYWIAIWAMTVAPIALVAALREASVLFAIAISVIVMREALTRWRLLAALAITTGVVVMRLG